MYLCSIEQNKERVFVNFQSPFHLIHGLHDPFRVSMQKLPTSNILYLRPYLHLLYFVESFSS